MEGMGEYVRRFLRKQESLDSEGGRSSGFDSSTGSELSLTCVGLLQSIRNQQSLIINHQFLTHPILNPSPLTVAISFLSCPSSIAFRK